MKNEKIIEFNLFRQICLKNAEDALKASENLLGENLNHIVYHLAVLAIEEIGQIFMAYIKFNAKESWDNDNIKIGMDDHVKKLFYALWAPSIGHELITKSHLTNNQLTASAVHKRRLDTLYSDINNPTESSLKITNEEAQAIVNFAKACLNHAKVGGDIKEDNGLTSNMEWLEKFMEIEGKRNNVFGEKAQLKLIEFGNVDQWIEWIKDEYENEQRVYSELLENELKKTPTSEFDKIKPKWEIGFTIITPSHSIRSSILTRINKKGLLPFTLFAGKNNHTLVVKRVLGDNVPIDDLWGQGWMSCKLFVAALNIGANGVFYWNINTDVDKYYDYIIDIENKKRLDVKLITSLNLNWDEKKMYLNELNLEIAFLLYEYLIGISDSGEAKPITEYLSALGMLAKIDIHLRLESTAFNLFHYAFQLAIQEHEIIVSELDVFETGYLQIEKMLNGREEFDRVIKIGQQLLKEETSITQITLKEVIAMKQYCEIYFLTIAVRKLMKDKEIRLTTLG